MSTRVLGPCLAAAILGACSGSASPQAAPVSAGPRSGSPTSPIQHVVLIIEENRSFDNFFARFPGADGATRGKMKVQEGGKWVDKWVKLQPHTLLIGSDINHCHKAFEKAYDGGKMDGFNLEYLGNCGESHGPPAGRLVYQYVEKSQIKPYWDLAEHWVLGDHMFQTQGSGSFIAHQDLIRGGTAINSNESLIDNPTGPPWGCDAAPGTVTSLITTSGQYLWKKGPFPCTSDFPSSVSYETMRDLLDAHGVSWKFYTPCFIAWNKDGCDKGCPTTCSGALLNAFDVIYRVRYGPQWGTNVSMPDTNVLKDIQNGALPAVSWVIPSDNNSDHPQEKVDHGPAWVASIVNAIGQSPYWTSTVVCVLWDDWGGFYDNEAPPFQDDQGGLGLRVPFIVVSPYAIEGSAKKGGYVSHTQYEFGSILKYIEENWNLGSLGTTDKRATSIGDVLDYSQSPRAFTVIPADQSIQFFLNAPRSVSHGDPE
jgi:phospholipase C